MTAPPLTLAEYLAQLREQVATYVKGYGDVRITVDPKAVEALFDRVDELLVANSALVDERRAWRSRAEAAEDRLEAVRRVIDYFEAPDDSAVKEAARADLAAGMSLRRCANKHGLPFGIVRGIANRDAIEANRDRDEA